MRILLTGGAGYIGSHMAVALLERGYEVVIVDNFVNSSPKVIERIERLSGKKLESHELDIRDSQKLEQLLRDSQCDAVIHFAGLKAVGESVEKPLLYYDNNVGGTISLMNAMQACGIHKLVFSSTAVVYGSSPVPYLETAATGVGITNPYGQTKYMSEQILRDAAASDSAAEYISLRYFNPVGAHQSGEIGELPKGVPNNLMPYISQVAGGQREKLNIWGDDYDTLDGTGVRDYIHVVDLVEGHLAALEHLQPGFDAVNLGSGKGTSVLELLHAFEKACGHNIAYEICPRRDGDLAEYYADVAKAERLYGWRTKRDINEMCEDAWRWQEKNPLGYE